MLGEEHPDTLRSRYWLARSLDRLGRREEAGRLLKGLRDATARALGDGHEHVKDIEELENDLK